MNSNDLKIAAAVGLAVAAVVALLSFGFPGGESQPAASAATASSAR